MSKKLIGSMVVLIIVLIAGGVWWWTESNSSSTPSPNNATSSGQQVTQSGEQAMTGNGTTIDGVTISGAQNDQQGADVDNTGGVQGEEIVESDALKDPDVQEVLKLFEDLTK